MSEHFTYDPFITSAFKAIGSQPSVVPYGSKLNAVVIGGGTGANVSIRTMVNMGFETSAVVAMADDGGSTGILRDRANVTAPGDIRKCIGALAADQDDPLTIAFKYRFPFADNHTLGNLMLAALEEATGSFPEAIAICEKLLNAKGHVYPSTLDQVLLAAQNVRGETLRGQANCSHSSYPLQSVWLECFDDCNAYQGAVDAIRDADVIILGPGSLFTSIIPNLLVPGIIDAIEDSKAPVVFIAGVSDVQGETRGLSVSNHVHALFDHGMLGLINYALIHSQAPVVEAREARRLAREGIFPNGKCVSVTREDLLWIERNGIKPVVRNLVNPSKPTIHDPAALRNALREVFRECLSPQM